MVEFETVKMNSGEKRSKNDFAQLAVRLNAVTVKNEKQSYRREVQPESGDDKIKFRKILHLCKLFEKT